MPGVSPQILDTLALVLQDGAQLERGAEGDRRGEGWGVEPGHVSGVGGGHQGGGGERLEQVGTEAICQGHHSVLVSGQREAGGGEEGRRPLLGGGRYEGRRPRVGGRLVARGGREGGEGGEGGSAGGQEGRPREAGGVGGAGEAGDVDWRHRSSSSVEGTLILTTLGSSVLKPDLDTILGSVLSPFSGLSHLNSCLAQPQLLTEFLSHESVWIVSLVKQSLKSVELLQAESIR